MNAFLIQTIVVILLAFFKADKNFVFAICIISSIITAFVYTNNIKSFTSLLIFGILLLDYDIYFSFTEFKIRLWYLLLPLILIFSMKKINIKGSNITYIFIFIYLLIISLVKGGFIHYIKYLIYFICLLTLVKMYDGGWYRLKCLFPILISPVYFCFIQLVLYEFFGLDSFLWVTPRPSAFFSESTWFGAYCVLIICYIYYLHQDNKIALSKFVINIFLVVIMLLIAKSFNAILGLLLFASYYWFYFTKNRLITSFLLISLTLCCFWVMQDRISSISSDLSFLGRIKGFTLLYENLKESSILGSGFGFDSGLETIDSGASLGSKAFSLPFQVYAIGGLPLLCFCLYLILKACLSDYRNNRYICLALLIIFIAMSTFAPLAQGIIGLLFIWLRMCCKTDRN